MRGRRRNALRPQRRPVFLGCEGESERGYALLLGRLADAAGLHLHFVTPILAPGAGDPLQQVRKAARLHAEQRAKLGRGNPFIAAAILLDGDRRADDPDRFRQAEQEASRCGLVLMVQEPNHEAFLLRHLPGHHDDRPARSTVQLRLHSAWPEYRKGMAAVELARRIDMVGVRAACRSEDGLAALLRALGFLL